MVLCITGLFGWQLQKGLQVDTNVLSLLPATEQDPLVEDAIRRFTEHIGQRTLFLFGHPSPQKARRAAQIYLKSLTQSGAFSTLTYRFQPQDQKAIWSLYFPHRWSLLSPVLRQKLQKPGAAQHHLQEVLRTLHSPMSATVSGVVGRDPLLLFPAFLKDLPRPPGALEVRDQWMVLKKEGKTYVFATAASKRSIFSRPVQKQLAKILSKAHQEMKEAVPEATLLSTGALYFAQAGGRSAEREISTIGLGSLLGLLVLLVLVFRSLRPILLGALPLGLGFLMAWTTCIALFGRVHMLTLVFGASLIGVCIDYAFHYLSEQRMAPVGWTPALGIKHIFPGITLGAITSVIGYLGMLIAPFPGLQQVAVFSAVGLLGAYGTVLCWFPLLSGPPQARPAPALLQRMKGLLVFWQALKESGLMRWQPLLVFGLLLPGWLILRTSDDVRLLYHAPPSLRYQDDTIKHWIGSIDGSRFFLIEGNTEEQVLEREEKLRKQLKTLQAKGKLGFVQSISAFVPSLAQQKRDHALLQRVFAGPDQALAKHMQTLGFSKKAMTSVQRALKQPLTQGLTVQQWLTTRTPAASKVLWLGRTSRGFASIVMLGGVKETAALEAFDRPKGGVHYVDKVGDVNKLFRRYRVLASWLVSLAYVMIFLLLLWRYGWHQARFVITPPLIAAGAALAAVGATGQTLNLFHLLALLLVLGIGIDYTIFFAEAKERWQPTLLAVLLSACTTLLSFGLLALSQTPLLRSFGFVVLIGISVACFLAPMASVTREGEEEIGLDVV